MKGNKQFSHLRMLALAVALAAATVRPAAAAADPAACWQDTPRLTFEYWPPGTSVGGNATPAPKEIRAKYPRFLQTPTTDAERAALHPVLWPSDRSTRFTLRHWLLAERFDCVEQAFRDLDGVQARYADGDSKVVSFLATMPDLLDARNGMTERDIETFMQRWRTAQPDSLLVELLGPRLLNAAAWDARGTDTADKVTPEGLQLFRSLNAKALQQVKAARASTQTHLLWHYLTLRLLGDNRAPVEALDTLTFAALKRFPDDIALALVAGNQHMPQWGGSPRAFEAYAVQVRSALGAERGDIAYAMLYTRLMGTPELLLHPAVQRKVVRAGLVAAARSSDSLAIQRLQLFACSTRDEPALRAAQDLWVSYGREPQLSAPATELDARCRAWVETLPPR